MAFGVLIALCLGVFSYFTYMQQRRVLRYQQLFAEYNQHLARVGMHLARREIELRLRNRESEEFRRLSRSFDSIEWNGDGLAPLHETPIDVKATYSVILEKICKDLIGGEGNLKSLTAQAYLALVDAPDLRKFPPWTPGSSGAAALGNGREKWGRLFIEVVSVFQGASFMNAHSVTLRGYYEFRVLGSQPPVLRHFTLFLHDPLDGGPDATWNRCAVDDKGSVQTGGFPLILCNGLTGDREYWGQGTALRDALPQQGWVYLGGGREQILNLAYSEEETRSGLLPETFVGEDFHFFLYEVGKESKGRAYVNEVDQQKANVPPSDWELRNWDMGVSPLGQGLPASYERCFLAGALAQQHSSLNDKRKRSSLLRLFGRGGGHKAISPTMVFGDVRAGFLKIALAWPRGGMLSGGANASNYFCILRPPVGTDLQPFLPEWQNATGSGRPDDPRFFSGKFLWQGPGGTPLAAPLLPASTYGPLASGYKTRPYNQALLYLQTANHTAQPTTDGTHQGLNLPPEVFGVDPAQPWSSLESVPDAMAPEEEKACFEDLSLADLPRAMEKPEFLIARASRHFDPGAGATFPEFLTSQGFLTSDGTLSLGATVLASGPISLPPIARVVRGGTIIADGITVTGGIHAVAQGQHLALVARTGNLRLETKDPVQASLIALKGLVTCPEGMDVWGQIVARGLQMSDLEALSAPSFLGYARNKLKVSSEDDTFPLVVDLGDTFVQVQ